MINPLRVSIPNFENPTARTSNVIFHYPINKLDRSTYELADYVDTGIQLPDDIKLEGKYGWYEASYLKQGDELQVTEHFALHAGTISVEDYPSFYQFIQTIVAYKKKSAILIR